MIEVEKFTITFNSDGGSSVESIKMPAGVTINAPVSPTKEDYEFLGWYDSNGNLFEFATMPEKNITLTAHWKQVVFKVSFSGSYVNKLTVKVDGTNKTVTSSTILKIRYNQTLTVTITGDDGGMLSTGASRKFTVTHNGTTSKQYVGSGGGKWWGSGKVSEAYEISEILSDIVIATS